MSEKKEELFRVKYRFKDEKDFITVTVSEQQYLNLLELPVIATCEIVDKAEKPVSKEEKEMFNEKIRAVCKDDMNHTKYFLE
ncbi:MAG TPA: hypothetical protein VFG25_05620 [Nitrosopumilaceae archaeon]|nr:hypothetical protein [Nitrosopumilaceae archaeon]